MSEVWSLIYHTQLFYEQKDRSIWSIQTIFSWKSKETQDFRFLVQDETFCIYFCTQLWFDFIQLVTDKPKDLIPRNEIASRKFDIFYTCKNRKFCKMFSVFTWQTIYLFICGFLGPLVKIRYSEKSQNCGLSYNLFLTLLCSVKL